MHLLEDGKPAARFIRRSSIPTLSEKRDDIGKTWLIQEIDDDEPQSVLITNIIPNTGNYQVSGIAFKDGYWYSVTIVIKDAENPVYEDNALCSILFVPRDTPFLRGNTLEYYESQLRNMIEKSQRK